VIFRNNYIGIDFPTFMFYVRKFAIAGKLWIIHCVDLRGHNFLKTMDAGKTLKAPNEFRGGS
jgi:hypothetical protein